MPTTAPILGDWTADFGYHAGRELLTVRDFTAIFASNDQMALGVMHAVRDAGLEIPRDITVVGFDDIPEAAHFWPPLTTVRQDFAELGRRCVALLLGRPRPVGAGVPRHDGPTHRPRLGRRAGVLTRSAIAGFRRVTKIRDLRRVDSRERWAMRSHGYIRDIAIVERSTIDEDPRRDRHDDPSTRTAGIQGAAPWTRRGVPRDQLRPQIEVAIARVRADVARLHGELTRYGLVVWTGGNVSGRVPGADLFVIKPSGVSYDDLAPENMILCDLDGNVDPGHAGLRAAARRATPRRTPTCTATCPRSAVSCTPTRRTRRRGRRAASRSRA